MTLSTPAPMARRFPVLSFLALIASAVAMGVSPVFVRLGEVGPFTGAFYRVLLALPLLYVWARVDVARAGTWVDPGWTRATFLCGLFFAGDLFFWHLSIFSTTIANATLLATMAPVWVAGFSVFIGEKVGRKTIIGLILCVTGGFYLVGSSFQLSPQHLTGDLYGVATSFFFGLYFLVVRMARREAPTGVVLFRSTVVTAAVLGLVAAMLENAWLPTSLAGLAALVAMAWISHVGGQGLLAYALGHLSAAFSSLVIFLEALAAALFGWLIFGETLGVQQLVGGAAILLGIWVARPQGDH